MSFNDEINPLRIALDRAKRNPLIAALPKKLSTEEMATALRETPITPEYVQEISLHDRPALLTCYRTTFVPTVQGLSIALSLQQMLYDGYAQRDPMEVSARKFIYEGGQLKGLKLSDMNWWPSFASGMVIDGITGMGKSQLVDQFLKLIPQKIEHGANEECGWRSLKQLCWLKIHMASDGSRGGFLEGAFREMDKQLGTNYCQQYSSRSWTVEKLLVVFLHLLAVHRCGLLVIEEAQEKTLSQSPFVRDFVTFFLRLLNWGVPTVLIGNPLAFTNLKGFSQDVDRFSEGGWHHLLPILDPDSEEWVEDWIPGLWTPTLLDHPDAEYTPFSEDPHDQTLARFVWKRTGGVPRYLARLRIEVQDVALRMGLQQVTPDLVDLVYRTSPKMIELHDRIEAFVHRDWQALQRFSDIPWNEFRKLWAQPAPGDEDIAPLPPEPETKPKAPKTPRAAAKKTRVTKDTPMPPRGLTAAEVRKRLFQDGMAEKLRKSSGLSPD